MNTITTSNTSRKAFIFRDKKDNYNENDNENGELNNLDKDIYEFDDDIKRPRNDRTIDNKISDKARGTNEAFHSSKILQNFVSHKKITHNEVIRNEDDDNIDYGNIANLTEEGKDDEIKKYPNISGIIHNKGQLENEVNLRKPKDDSYCTIF